MARAQTKINNLQALRAFAAGIVVFFHTGYVYPHLHAVGSFGVDIFFVLSGYIMARICEKNPAFFLRRRLIRIVPPYWTLTLLLFLVALKFPALMGTTRPRGTDLLESLFFIPFFKAPGLIRPLLFVGWSLNYEMFFYLVIWLSLFLIPKRPLLATSACILIVHFGSLFLDPRHVFIAFFSEPYILEFPLGVLAYYVAKSVSAGSAARWRVASLAVLLACIGIFIALQLFRPPLSHEFGGSIYSILSTLIILSTSLLSQGGWDTRLTSVILIGDASYVLYLVHPYCESLLQKVVVPHLQLLRTDRPLGCFLAVLLSIVVGLLLHLYGERPVMNYLNQRFGGHRKSAEFGVLAETKGQVNP